MPTSHYDQPRNERFARFRGCDLSLVATTTLRSPLATTNPETSASLVFGVVTFLWSPPPPFDAH